jgi:hypothetical protein
MPANPFTGSKIVSTASARRRVSPKVVKVISRAPSKVRPKRSCRFVARTTRNGADAGSWAVGSNVTVSPDGLIETAAGNTTPFVPAKTTAPGTTTVAGFKGRLKVNTTGLTLATAVAPATGFEATKNGPRGERSTSTVATPPSAVAGTGTCATSPVERSVTVKEAVAVAAGTNSS